VIKHKNTALHLLELVGGLLLDAFDRTGHREGDGWDVVTGAVEVEGAADGALLLGVAEVPVVDVALVDLWAYLLLAVLTKLD